MIKEFYRNIFTKLDPHNILNLDSYFTMNRVSKDETQCVVKVDSSRLRRSKYETYMLILDDSHVVFIKAWAVCFTHYGPNVFLDEKYWNPKEFGKWDKYGEDDEMLDYRTWFMMAKNQDLEYKKSIDRKQPRVDLEVLWIN